MSFIEQLGKHLTDTGQKVVKQTRNLADIALLNAIIAEKEKEVSLIFMELGQSYYENHKNDEGVEESNKIKAITSLLDEIAINREKVNYIKDTGKCAECESGSTVEGQYCPNCHTLIGKEDLFCSSCGMKVEHNEVMEETKSSKN